MTSERDVTRIVRSWLEEGATRLPDRVLDQVLDQLPATPQRRRWWLARRFRQMNNMTRFAVAAAAVAVVAVVGISVLPGLLPGQGQFGAPGPTPTPTITPPPEPLGENRSLEPDTTYLVDEAFPVRPYTIRVPAGWEVFGGGYLVKNPTGTSGDAIMSLNAWLVDNVYSDPCTPADPPVGPSVDDLVAPLMAQFAGDGSASDVTIDGFSGKKLELSVPDDILATECRGVQVGRWQSSGGTGGFGGYIHGAGQRDTLYILDVRGERVVIHASYLPATPEADRADLQAMVDTIDFLP